MSEAEKKDVAIVFHTDVTCESGFDVSKQSVKIQDFISHASYSGEADATNDIALIKMKSSVPSDYEISEVYDGKSKLSNDTVTLAGYGITSEKSKNSSMFLRMTTKSFKNDVSIKEKNMIIQQPTNGICLGDSGGPVFVEVDGKLKIAAVNSVVGGKSDDTICHGKSVSMWAPYYIDWIQTQSANLN